jgi:hypothetical protein
MEESIVPFESESFPNKATFGLVEGEKNEKKNGKIKKREDEGGPRTAEPANEFRPVGHSEKVRSTQEGGIGH